MHDPASSTPDEAQLTDVIAQQQQRWQRIDARLPQIPTSCLPSLVKKARESSHLDPIIVGPSSRPDCIAFPVLLRLSPDSDDLVYFDILSGTAIQIAFRDDLQSTLSGSFANLISRLEDVWNTNGATAGLINWPTRDREVADYVMTAGYTLDSHLAVRRGVPALPLVHRSLPAVNTRLAVPDDEPAILELHSQVVQAHIPNAPFARNAPTAKSGMQTRLSRVWAGETTDEGASLVIVADIADRVVAMAECQIGFISAQPDALLPPGKYALIKTFGVAQGLRRRGIGHILEQAVSAACTELSADGFYLIFSPYNPSATAFWSSVGYEPIWTLYQKRGLNSAVSGDSAEAVRKL